jgi:hypothetical protein
MIKSNSGSKKQRSNNYETDVYFHDQSAVLVIAKALTFVDTIQFLELREKDIRTTNVHKSLTETFTALQTEDEKCFPAKE